MKIIRNGLFIIGAMCIMTPVLMHAMPYNMEVLLSPDEQRLAIFISDAHKNINDTSNDKRAREANAKRRESLAAQLKPFALRSACIVEDAHGDGHSKRVDDYIQEQLALGQDVSSGEFLFGLQEDLREQGIEVHNAECRPDYTLAKSFDHYQKIIDSMATYQDDGWRKYYAQCLKRMEYNRYRLQKAIDQKPEIGDMYVYDISKNDLLSDFEYMYRGELHRGSGGVRLWHTELVDMHAIHIMSQLYQEGKKYIVFVMGGAHTNAVKKQLHSKGWKTIYNYEAKKLKEALKGQDIAEKLRLLRQPKVTANISLDDAFNLFYQKYPYYHPQADQSTIPPIGWLKKNFLAVKNIKKPSNWFSCSCSCSAKPKPITTIIPAEKKENKKSNSEASMQKEMEQS